MNFLEKLKDVFGYIDSHTDEMIFDLKRYLRQPSVSIERYGIEECAQMTLDFLSRLGASGEIMALADGKGCPAVWAELNCAGARSTLVVYNMYDVKSVSPERWTSPPFEAKEVDGRIIARGAVNTKGPLLAFIKGIEAILASCGTLPVNLIFVIDGEEEISSPNFPEVIRKKAERLKGAKCAYMQGICPRSGGALQIILGCRGNLKLELVARAGEKEVHSSKASILKNPAWRLIYALNSMKNANGEILIEGFHDQLVPPSEYDEKLLKTLSASLSEEDLRKIKGQGEIVAGLDKMRMLREMLFKPTFNINGLQSGYQGVGTKTIIPHVAAAKLDIRLVPQMDPADTCQKIKNHLAQKGFGDIEVRAWPDFPEGYYKPTRTRADSQIANAAIEAAKLMGLRPHVWPMTPAGIGVFEDLACPPLCLDVALAEGYEVEDRAHAPDEYLTTEEFINTAKYSAAILLKYASLM